MIAELRTTLNSMFFAQRVTKMQNSMFFTEFGTNSHISHKITSFDDFNGFCTKQRKCSRFAAFCRIWHKTAQKHVLEVHWWIQHEKFKVRKFISIFIERSQVYFPFPSFFILHRISEPLISFAWFLWLCFLELST